jgi:hypothetical protein
VAPKLGKTHPDTFDCNKDFEKLLKAFPDKANPPHLKKIEFYTDGSNIHGYEFFYKAREGNEEEYFQVGHHIGTMVVPSVRCITLNLADDEFVNYVEAHLENIIDRMVLKTNKG